MAKEFWGKDWPHQIPFPKKKTIWLQFYSNEAVSLSAALALMLIN